jgi:hypothetical protein
MLSRRGAEEGEKEIVLEAGLFIDVIAQGTLVAQEATQILRKDFEHVSAFMLGATGDMGGNQGIGQCP